MPTAIAIVGAGFVADYYLATLPNHPELAVAGVWDRDAGRLAAFTRFHGLNAYAGLDALLADASVAIVVNLTTPESHYEINSRALLAGKHVYSEKPFATRFEQAQELVDLARMRGLTLASAPANGLSDAHALVEKTLAEGAIGAPRLVYAQMEDGAVFRMNWRDWRSRSGAPWPGVHEFETGSTLEHAGYALAWLVSLFGPVEAMTRFSALAFPDKGEGTQGLSLAPETSVGCLRFRSGVVARLTCGLAAPRDRSLQIFGERGALTVGDLWDDRAELRLERVGEKSRLAHRLANRLEARLGRALPWKPAPGRRLAYPAGLRRARLPAYPSQIDFARGVAAQAAAVAAGVAPRFSGALALHVNELALALASPGPADYRPLSSC